MGVFVTNFGVKKGVQTFRVNGTYEELYQIIDECRKMEAKFADVPNLLPLRKSEWTMLLQIKLPVKTKEPDRVT